MESPSESTAVPQSDRLTVAVIDQQTLVREALVLMLRASLVEATGFRDPQALLDGTTLQPHVALLTIDPPDLDASSLLAQLPRLADRCSTIVLSDARHVASQAQAMELGARGILTKDDPPDVLVKALSKVHHGELWLDRTRTAAVLTRLRRERAPNDPEKLRVTSLTPRECEIVSLVAEGLRNSQIADRLSISEATARNHLTSILDKLELTDRFELAVYAYRRGLVSLPPTPSTLRLTSVPVRVPQANDSLVRRKHRG
jgi:DNA-binding NarL/FixJ family response regulator